MASAPTLSRLIDTLAASGPEAFTAIHSARVQTRQRVGELAAASIPAADGQVTVDIDGVLVLEHSEKQDATATWKKTFGHHPLVAFVDHGPAGSGQPVAALMRPGNAGSNTAADHITSTRLALAQLPGHLRRGRQTLIRTDSAGGTHAFLDWLSRPGRWLSYSVGTTIADTIHQAVLKIPKKAWTPAYDADGTERPELALTGKTRRWERKKLRMRLSCRPAREHRPPPLAALHRPMVLDRCHHPRNRQAPCLAEPWLTRSVERPDNPHHHIGEMEPGAHPTRQPGPRPAPAPKRPHTTYTESRQQAAGNS